MKILVTGKGSAGSWKIRGEQLGHEIGARVVPKATKPECQRADVVIAVKRLNHIFFDAVRDSGRPWIWDLVDLYPQPTCTAWTAEQSIHWVRDQIKKYKPNAIIWPNKKMMDDCCDGKTPGVVIYHHHKKNIPINPIREKIQAIGYEGEPKYIAEWLPVFEKECQRHSWNFIINPTNISDLDVVVAMRGNAFNGYAQRSWKSNVKLANAQASGTPFIGACEPSYVETGSGAEILIGATSQVPWALEQLVPRETRSQRAIKMMAAAYPVAAAAADLKAFINKVF